jgi:hypothetical protein
VNFSDIVVDCSRRCTALAAKCTEPGMADELRRLADRLLQAAAQDAELAGLSDAVTHP